MSRACVIGSGPNGLAAAIALAQAGLRVDVYEAEAEPGGAARSLPLTLPGFLHDFGSAVYPFAVGSPFLSALPLAHHGLEWIHGEAPLAHPLDDGTAVVLERDLGEAVRALGTDGAEWRRLLQPAVDHWKEFAEDSLRPAACAFLVIPCAWRDSASPYFSPRKVLRAPTSPTRARVPSSLAWWATLSSASINRSPRPLG